MCLPLRFLLAVVLCHCLAPLARSSPAEAPEPTAREVLNREEILARIKLFPFEDKRLENRFREVAEKKIKRSFSLEELALLNRGAEGEWTTYEDEYIRFEYPASPLLKIKMKEKTKATGEIGRGYHLVMGTDELPYLSIFMYPASWFTEGICLCGAIILESYVPTEGNLLKFSLMGDGVSFKKIEALNDTHLATMGEWTHQVLSNEAFTRIGLSLRLKQPSKRSLDQWIAESRKPSELTPANSPERRVGWLYVGATEAEIIAAFGEPLSREGNTLIYSREEQSEFGSREKQTIRLVLNEDGKLGQLQPGWRSSEELPSARGSDEWIYLKFKELGKLDEHERRRRLPEEDIALLWKVFFEAVAEGNPQSRGPRCQIGLQLLSQGYDSPELKALVMEIYEKNLPDEIFAADLLDKYQPPGAQELFRKRLRYILTTEKFCQEVGDNLAQLDFEAEEDFALLRSALKHPEPVIRYESMNLIEKLPRDEAREIWRVALSDSDKDVRRSAIFKIVDLGERADIPWLETLAAADPIFGENFQTEIRRLKPPKEE